MPTCERCRLFPVSDFTRRFCDECYPLGYVLTEGEYRQEREEADDRTESR